MIPIRNDAARSAVTSRVAAVAMLACLATSSLQAQRERYAPLVTLLPVSARTMAMGGLTAATRDVDAVFGNPALVGGNNTLSMTGGHYSSGASTGHIAAAMTIGALGLGFGVQFLDAPQAAVSNRHPSDVLTDDGSLAASNLAATVAASMSWKGMRWGAGATYAEDRSSTGRGGALAADIGVSRNIRNGRVTTGVAIQHLGRALSLDGRSVDLPARLSLGASTGGYGVGTWFDLGGSVNVIVRRDGQVLPVGGAELTYVPIEGISLIVRAGARAPELQAQRALTGGVGLVYDRLGLDYGWEDMRGKGGAHRVTVRVR